MSERDGQMAPFTFRRVSRADFPLIAEWLAQPHIARWWNHEFTPEAVERDFGSSVDGAEPGEDYLALLDGRPAGLIQYSRYADYPEYLAELARLTPVPEHAVSIDYLIGDATLTGRGLGKAMITRFDERVWEASSVATCIVVPVNAANEASWRALLGAGFRIVARGEMEPDNPMDGREHLILRLDRPEDRGGPDQRAARGSHEVSAERHRR
jgi:aminoglycoside 6'-N-acetyltransferase